MYKDKRILAIIPARGGSKGLPGKNIKPLNGKSLIYFSIDVSRQYLNEYDICVSTDDLSIIEKVEAYGLKVPFQRPDKLATDCATTNDVLLHAIDFYEARNIRYDVILLLQPTSPLRTVRHVEEALKLYRDDIDMVVSVMDSHAPSLLCREAENGYMDFVLNKEGSRRQNLTNYYEYNGAIYVINVGRLKQKMLSGLSRKIKYVKPRWASVDIDDAWDWFMAEQVLKLNFKI